jgi:hypothetical protein
VLFDPPFSGIALTSVRVHSQLKLSDGVEYCKHIINGNRKEFRI